MPRLPQPAALWVGYNLFRLIAVVFMLWCLITQFISLADEIKMLNQLATLQGNATTLPIRLNSTAPNLSSTNLTTNTTHKSSSTGTGEKSKSSSSTSTSSQAEYSTAYSEISVTSATTLRRISTIPPSPEPTGGTSASSSDVSSGSGGSTGPALGLGTGDTGSSGGSASSSDVAGSSVGGGTSLLEGSGGSGSPLVGRGETLKRRGRWLVRGQNGEVAAVGTLRQGVHPVEGGMTQGIDKEGGLNKRADVDGEDAKGDKKAKESGNASGNATAVDTGGVIGPWRPEVPAFAAISRLCLAALLGLLVLAQVGVPEVWLHDNVASIGPQCTPLVLGCVQLFVAIETLRAPGKAHNLIGAWGVLLISILNILSGIFLWYRARPLPRDPPPALWFSHSVRLLYFRSLPAFYAPLFRVHPSVGDDDAEWVEAESQLEGVNELVGLDKRIEDEETAQNTRVNAGNGGYAGGMTDADMGLAAKIATEGRGDGPAALGASQHAQPSVEQTSKSKSRSKTSRSNGYNTKIKGQPASTDLLSDIALGPTSQRSPGILGTNTLNPHLEDLPSHSNAAQYPSTTPGSRYDADPAIHADVRQGGYPTFTGAGIAQAGRQIPAGQVRVDSRTGDVVAFDLEEEWHGKGEGGAGGGGERGEGGKEELAVVKLAERVSVYASAITGAEVLSVPHSRNGEMAHQSKSSLEREGRGRTGKDNSDRSSRSRDRDRKGERERKLPDPPGQPGVERPETVHSLLPPVNPHKPGRSRELPDSKVSPARRIPTDGIGIAGSAALTSVSVNGSGRSGHRRTPSIGKQSLAADASHRISDPSNLDTMKRNPNPAYAHDTRPEGQDGELHRPGLMFSHSSSSVESGYSGLAYDRPSKRPNHPSIQLPEPSPLTPSLGQSRDKSTGTRSTPRTPRTPKTPLLTPSPTPLTPAHVSRAQTGTVRPVSQFHFPSASASLASDQSAAEKSRGKRGTMIGKGFVRPRELDMSDDELDLVQGQLGEGESSRVGYGRGEMRRRVSSLEEEIRDLLSPPLRSQSSLAGKDGHVGHGPDERTCIGAEQTERKRAMRKSILPPGSLTQHIQAIEQQQQQQQKRLEQLSAGGLSVTPASTTSTDSAPATFPGADPDRPPSALKGSVSNSLTPPRNRPARQLRFALSPIPDTPTPVGAGQDHASSGKEGSESVSASVLGAVAGKVKQKASGKTKSSSSTKPSSRERDREAGRGKEEVPSSGSSSSQAKSTSSTASKSKARSANKTSDAPGDSAVKEGAEPTESASYTIAALGMTLALPAGLVGGITTPLSSARGSGGGMSSAPPGKTEFEHREHRERRRGDDGGGGGGRGKEREREEKRRDRRMRRGSVQV